jgi:hypothetical protein
MEEEVALAKPAETALRFLLSIYDPLRLLAK